MGTIPPKRKILSYYQEDNMQKDSLQNVPDHFYFYFILCDMYRSVKIIFENLFTRYTDGHRILILFADLLILILLPCWYVCAEIRVYLCFNYLMHRLWLNKLHDYILRWTQNSASYIKSHYICNYEQETIIKRQLDKISFESIQV